MTLPANYVEMKDSGIPWIGEIPTDWTLKRIKYLCNREPDSFVDGDWIESPHITDSGIRYLTTGNIGDGFFKRQGNGYITDKTFKELNCKYAYPGDLIISRLNAPYGRACILPADEEKYVLAVDNVILRTDENKSFLCYLMQCEGYQDCVQDGAKGTTMRRISRTNLGNVMLPIPPRSVQSAIVAYLDDQCAKIGEIIAEATASIEEYKAWKASIIYEAVTKGLNPNAEMKDSTVPWLGFIPDNWNVCALKHLTTKIGSGKTPPGGAEVYTTEGVMFLRSQNIYNTGLVIDAVSYISMEIDAEMENTRVQYQDVLLNITGGSIGRCCLFDLDGVPANVNQHVCILRTDKAKLLPQYLRYFWNSASGPTVVAQYQTGGNRPGLNFEQIGMTKIPYCSIEEQHRIVDFLDARCYEIDALVREKETLITDLEEYKKSLIFETVTGKRKVV